MLHLWLRSPRQAHRTYLVEQTAAQEGDRSTEAIRQWHKCCSACWAFRRRNCCRVLHRLQIRQLRCCSRHASNSPCRVQPVAVVAPCRRKSTIIQIRSENAREKRGRSAPAYATRICIADGCSEARTLLNLALIQRSTFTEPEKSESDRSRKGGRIGSSDSIWNLVLGTVGPRESSHNSLSAAPSSQAICPFVSTSVILQLSRRDVPKLHLDRIA
ncbi:uncharacterized protein BDV17DRAFT_80601 [Aspergillus undulatus]|uniref:uncharacterized protein n=1 Tax=Aspergillus undulatus TaxID=1810928 RepID=UPI003CCD9225